MKPHPRVRKTIKWGGAAVTVLLVMVWAGSGWRQIWWGQLRDFEAPRPLTYMIVIGGDIAVGHDEYAGAVHRRDKILFVPLHSELGFRWFVWMRSPSAWVIRIPMWAVVAPIASATVLAWWWDTLARRRARLNLCPKCNYDRTGLAVGAKCPECGSVGRLEALPSSPKG